MGDFNARKKKYPSIFFGKSQKKFLKCPKGLFNFSTYFTPPFKTHFLASIYDHPFSISSLVFIQNVRKKVMFLSVHCVCWCPILNRRNLAKERPILKGNWAASENRGSFWIGNLILEAVFGRQPTYFSSQFMFPNRAPYLFCVHNKNWKNQQIHWIFAASAVKVWLWNAAQKLLDFKIATPRKRHWGDFSPILHHRMPAGKKYIRILLTWNLNFKSSCHGLHE